MSCDPFDNIDDALFHDFGSEEVLEEPLDTTDPFERRKTKHFVLRIKPLAMKRQWRGMSIRSKNNYDKAQHIESLLYLIPLYEGDVVKPCLPPTHNVEEPICLND